MKDGAPQEFPPERLRERLQQILPEARYEAFLDQALLPRRSHVRVNTLRSDVREVREDLDRMGIEHAPLSWCDHAFSTTSEPRALQRSGLWKSGGFHIQSPSSIATSLVLEPEPGERILDMCAAPGSKTSHIAALMNNEGELVANDLSKPRMHRMRALLELLGVHAQVRRSAGEQIGRREPDSFDRILVDAPCSGEGRMRLAFEQAVELLSLLRRRPCRARQGCAANRRAACRLRCGRNRRHHLRARVQAESGE